MPVFVTDQDQLVVWEPGEHHLEDNFLRFHAQNPRVYQELVSLAFRWRERRPGEKCGIGMLFEVARWNLLISTAGEPVKLNNNYRAFYARMIMEHEPDLDGLFELRRQRP